MTAQRFQRTGPLAIRPSAMFELFVGHTPHANTELAEGATQVVTVTGPLSQAGTGSWCDTYEAVRARVQAALASSARAVILKLNSPGGDLYGALDTARAIRADAEVAHKPLAAFVDGEACSAAYALACAADSITLGQSAVVGSIGVVQAREDVSLALAARGVSVSFVTSGSRKAYGHPELGMTEAEFVDTQATVNQLAEPFLAYVAERRGLPVETVAGYEAGVFTGSAALQARLADDNTLSIDALSALLLKPKAEVKPMAMSMSEIKKALQAAAEGDDPKEQAAALKMLAAMTAEEEPDGDEATPAGESDEEKPDAESDEGDDEEKKEPPPGAASVSSTVSASTASGLASQLAAATQRIAALERANERVEIDGLLKGQPKALRDALRDKPVADVRAIVAALPKPGRLPVVTTLSTPQGTPAAESAEAKAKAKAEADARQIDPRILEKINRQTRHGAVKKTATRMIGGSLYFDVPDDYDPRKYGLNTDTPNN